MNRFRSRKKSFHDGGEEPPRPSTDSEVPALPSFTSRTFKRGKKSQPETKPALDLSIALPSSDNFRTSLLMPNLSARFSMLREQDDPKSLLGKANDDSVLFPKRSSRLDLFNRNGLSNISEVDSIRGSIRPPFAFDRTNSYGSAATDGYGTDDDASHSGSLMSRSRPGEGNTLFGGRQKIYKIPVGGSGSSKNVSGNEDSEPNSAKGMGGKVMYGDDIATSAFQKLRDQARREREREEQECQSTSVLKGNDRSGSPPLANYNRNRETGSSTTSVPSQPRTSTAATSVASHKSNQGGGNVSGSSHGVLAPTQGSVNLPTSDRQHLKSRRLYGQGLDQQMYDQQSSAMLRLESLHRQRTIGGQPFIQAVQQSRSTTNMHDRFQRSGPLYASNGFRAGSPPPSATPPRMADFDLGLTEEHPALVNGQNDFVFGSSPSLSPLVSPNQDTTFIPEPNDIGKATASGAFNKPKQQYNEQQYLQRQLQLQQGRETPPVARGMSPQPLSIDEQTTSRTRNDSLASTKSRSESFEHYTEPQTADHALSMVPESHSPREDGRNSGGKYHPNMDGSFQAGMSGSEMSSLNEVDIIPDVKLILPDETQHPSIADHPLYHRHRLEDINTFSAHLGSDDLSETTETQSQYTSVPAQAKSVHLDADSPTLGPTNGLNGLVQAHLRNNSGNSSIYPEQSPELLAKFPHEVYNGDYSKDYKRSSGRSETFLRDGTCVRDSQDEDRVDAGQTNHMNSHAKLPSLSLRTQHVQQQTNMTRIYESPKAQQILGRDTRNKVQRVLGGDAPRHSHESSDIMSWQDQLKAHHSRAGSTETEKERESLANELAERRRMVQDSLKSFVDNESRSGSPMPGARSRDDSPVKTATPFGVLKSKTSRSSLAGKNDKPSKAMKMLGLGASPSTVSLVSRPSQESFSRREDDLASRYSPQGQGASPQIGREPQYRQALDNLYQRQRMPGRDEGREADMKRPSPPPSKNSRFTRSGSEGSERPSERSNGNQQERIQRANAERDRIIGYQPKIPPTREEANDFKPAEERKQRPEERPQSATSGRFRSNSRTNTPGYFDHGAPGPKPANATNNISTAPRQSPASPFSAQSTPSLLESTSNDSFAMPTMITPDSSHTARRGPTYRKQSINKHDISEPRFLSSTSSVITVDLPPGASLSNGMDPPPSNSRPPIPPLNPRRKRTQTLLQALGKSEKPETVSGASSPLEEPYEERSIFSADESEPQQKARQRLRKTSSEGGNLNAKARQHAMTAPGPAVPHSPPATLESSPTTSTPFPCNNLTPTSHPSTIHFPQTDVPASAVMF